MAADNREKTKVLPSSEERDESVMVESAPRFDAGTVLNDRYQIERLLGRGGMGEVYLASDTRINRRVALKVLHSDLLSSIEIVHRFTVEAQAVSALNHPHIMTVYEVDSTVDGVLFFVAEYVDGQTLNHLIGEGLDVDKALDIAIQVTSALSAAHEAGITHRDIKPENIMVRRDGYVKVLDFGLAKLAQPSTPISTSAGSEDPTVALHRTKPGAVMGTAAYMSPEQARGRHVDARTDIWSLGAVIYEMLTGYRAFPGETSADILVSVLSKEPSSLSAYTPSAPSELSWLVTKALSKDVEGRYQTAKGLRADLERIRKQIELRDSVSRSAGGIPSSLGNGVTTTPVVGRPTSGGQTAPRPFWSAPSFAGAVEQAKTHKLRFAAIAIVLMALVSAVVYFAFVADRRGGQIDSIAVLPFQNLSGNPDLTYAADGLSESLIDRLSELPQLKVISRSSSFKFRGTDIDPRDVASQLGVRAVVTGTVDQVGDELAVRIDVIDAAEDRQVAGGVYRRKINELVHVQNEIAQAAADQLRLKLTDAQTKRFTDISTNDPEAYRYYLNGLIELNGPQFVSSRALEYFEHAARLDQDFAAPHAEIAWVYYAQANNSNDPGEVMPKAKAAAARALEIDPNLAKAHVVQAMMHEYEMDWGGAENEYRRAIELSPNLDFARNNYAFFLSVMGRQEEALRQLEEQRVRDPINRRLGLLHKAIVFTQARRFDEALAAYRDAQAADPTKDIPSFSLGYAYGGKGLHNEAAGHYKKSVDLLGGEEKYSQPLVYLAAIYAKMPEKQAEARAILKRIEATERYASPALLAVVYSELGDNDKAMELLEQAYIKRDILLRYIGTGYEYDRLRSDPRFIDLMKRIGLGHAGNM